MDLANKTVVVTGASRGIGAAILTQLAKAGAYVIGTATSDKGIAAIEQTLQDAGLNGQGMLLNVADSASIAAFYDALKAQEKSVDVLVNNAGITADNLFMRMKDEEWNAVLQTNLASLHPMTKPVLRSMMKQRWGRIINISSVIGEMGNPGQANYAASKAGIEGFSRALAKEVASRGITVNCVAPGFIETDMTQALTEEQQAGILSAVPAQRLGSADEIGQLVTFLASDLAGYITGQTLHINGGLYM